MNVEIMPDVLADSPVKARAGQIESFSQAFLFESLIPARQSALIVFSIFAPQQFVERVTQRRFPVSYLIAFHYGDVHDAFYRDVILMQFLFAVASLKPCREEIGGIRADLASKEVERVSVPEVDVFLDNAERNGSQFARVAVPAFLHQLRRTSDDTLDARLADKHVMRLFGQHEAAGPAQRLEPGLGQRRELVLAVAVGEHCEAEVVQPVAAGLTEGLQNTWFVGCAAASLQQLFRFLSPVAPEVPVQQIDHGPQMPTFFHVHLEEIAQIVE